MGDHNPYWVLRDRVCMYLARELDNLRKPAGVHLDRDDDPDMHRDRLRLRLSCELDNLPATTRLQLGFFHEPVLRNANCVQQQYQQ